MRFNLSMDKQVLCSVIVVIVLAFVAEAHDKEFRANRTADTENALNKLVDKLTDKLFVQALNVPKVIRAFPSVLRPFQPVVPITSIRRAAQPLWPVQPKKTPLSAPRITSIWPIHETLHCVFASQDTVIPLSSASPEVEVKYELPVQTVEDIQSNFPLVSFDGSALRLFGPNVGLSKNKKKIARVETLSDHAPVEKDGVFSWNVMVKGKRIVTPNGYAYVNICFRDVQDALTSKKLAGEVEGYDVYESRMYAIARVVLHKIEQSNDFKVFFIQEASSVLMDIFESEDLSKDMERLKLLAHRNEQLITIVSKDALGNQNFRPSGRNAFKGAEWKWTNDRVVGEIAKSVSTPWNGLNFQHPRSYAIRGNESIFINMHVAVLAKQSRIAEAEQSKRADAILRFVEEVADQYPRHTIYIGGDMNTYANAISKSINGNPNIGVHAGNAANGRGDRIPLPHPVDAIIVHQRKEVPVVFPTRRQQIMERDGKLVADWEEERANKTAARQGPPTDSPPYLPLPSTPPPNYLDQFDGRPEMYKQPYHLKVRGPNNWQGG